MNHINLSVASLASFGEESPSRNYIHQVSRYNLWSLNFAVNEEYSIP